MLTRKTRLTLAVVLAAISSVACADNYSPESCADVDSVAITLDGNADSFRLLSGLVPEEAEGNRVFMIYSRFTEGAYEHQVNLALGDLVVGTRPPTDATQLGYRFYSPSEVVGLLESMEVPGIALSGTITTLSVASEPGDSICGSFDLLASGAHEVHVVGDFHHTLSFPRPGTL